MRGEGDTASLPLTDVAVPAEGLRIAALLTAAGLTPSNSEANRKLKERAVRIDGEVFEDPQRVSRRASRACSRSASATSRACGWSPPEPHAMTKKIFAEV